jgi:hypothetical protein
MKLKKILMFCSIFTMIFSGGSFALDNVSNDAEENIVKIVLVKDGKEQEITQDELDKIIEESNKEYVESEDIDNFNYNESHDARLVNPPRYQYIESSRIKEYHHKGRNKRITPYVRNDTSSTISRNISFSTTYSRSSDITLTTKEFNAINAQIGKSYGVSRTYSDSVDAKIKPKYESWVEFYPIVYKSYGTLRYYYDGINARDKKATTYFSRASKNGLDGVYTVKERKY